MRRRRPKKTGKKVRRKKTEEELARGRRATQECRDRERKRLALYLVAIDERVLDLLVRRGYIADHQVIEKREVDRALSAYLWDCAHSPERPH